MIPRLLAVLLTDVSGYTAFTSSAPRDELAGAIKQQQDLVPPIVARHRGRIVKWIGDAVLAVFESATDAVLCGAAIQGEFALRGARGGTAPPTEIKAVVTLGDLGVDADGDVYGEAVNLAARIEKVTTSGEVYFTEAVRMAVSRADVPHERVGAFDFKGIGGDTTVYRTVFRRNPSVSERAVLVFTDFAGVLKLADKHGWELVHPLLDDAVGDVAQAARAHGGTLRAVWGDGCFLTFATAPGALDAIAAWEVSVAKRTADTGVDLRLAAGLHLGEVRVMRHTTMGADVHVAETLCGAAGPGAILMTDEVRGALPGVGFEAWQPVDAPRWRARYGDRSVWRLVR